MLHNMLHILKFLAVGLTLFL